MINKGRESNAGRRSAGAHRFQVAPGINSSGNQVWKVRGFTRDGVRVREQFAAARDARNRAAELESQFLAVPSEKALRRTVLSEEQMGIAEAAFRLVEVPEDLLRAVEDYKRRSAERMATARGQGIRLDEAGRQFLAWLGSPECTMRPPTVASMKSTVRTFVAAVGNVGLVDLSSDLIQKFLDERWEDAVTRATARGRISRFVSWMMSPPRRWMASNPALSILVPVAMPEAGEPEIYTLRQCQKILAAARREGGGMFLRLVVLSLFGGLRPGEAARLPLRDINLRDGEIRIAAAHSKIGRARVVRIHPVLRAWLEVCPEGPTADRNNCQGAWVRFQRRLGFAWIADGLRHTAISHYFRAGGSYGLTAEWAGNSESIIKAHYQGRVTSAESAEFWNLFPLRSQRQAVRAPVVTLHQEAA